MKDLGATKKILGMEITRDRSVGKLFLSQQAYVEKVLKSLIMNNARPVTVPLAAHFKLSADMSPKKMRRWSTCLMFNIQVRLVASCMLWAKMSDSVISYVDSDFAGDLDKRRSLTGYLFTLSGNAISWKATLQAIVALFTTEAEYMALAEVVKEVL
ncbi:hypothetical protein GH714_033772 [Hevea brasiliensis]|uniref:Reverse transcriptase Ty1/copia-type domain-containing protein n=1 Tax=Hevea brasiliensis TaxID=3981 RepID=A0A6A6KLS3_HEVBR|nr:hypothetical protein GH714_033772 [Hevea brasiliensis]